MIVGIIFAVGFACVGVYFGYNYYMQAQMQGSEQLTSPQKGDFSDAQRPPDSARSNVQLVNQQNDDGFNDGGGPSPDKGERYKI